MNINTVEALLIYVTAVLGGMEVTGCSGQLIVIDGGLGK